MKYFLIKFINLYQKTISPDHGLFKARFPYGYCRFYPSCSQYTKESIEEYGILPSFPKIVKRIIKCNPFSTPSVDPVKNKN